MSDQPLTEQQKTYLQDSVFTVLMQDVLDLVAVSSTVRTHEIFDAAASLDLVDAIENLSEKIKVLTEGVIKERYGDNFLF